MTLTSEPYLAPTVSTSIMYIAAKTIISVEEIKSMRVKSRGQRIWFSRRAPHMTRATTLRVPHHPHDTPGTLLVGGWTADKGGAGGVAEEEGLIADASRRTPCLVQSQLWIPFPDLQGPLGENIPDVMLMLSASTSA